jgi:hypothetical protein
MERVLFKGNLTQKNLKGENKNGSNTRYATGFIIAEDH